MAYDIVAMDIPPRERVRKYNIDELEIGEAILIPAGEKFTSSAVYAAARSLNISIAIRKIKNPDTGEEDTAVFRVEYREPKTRIRKPKVVS